MSWIMPFRFPVLVVPLLAALAVGPVEAQETVAQIKSAPQDYRDRPIGLHGEVVELRGMSPRSTSGIYRLADESDLSGVLIRTRQLPEAGGPFQVHARLSPEILQNGLLLLDEIDRDLDRSPLQPLAMALAALGLIWGAGAFGLYLRARRAESHLRLGPPMWLIPTAMEGDQEGTTGSEEKEPPQHFNYRLHYIEEERSTKLVDRKRRMLLLAVGGAVVGLVGLGSLVALKRGEAMKPGFVLIAPTGAVLAAIPADSSRAAPPPDDSLLVALVPPAEDPRLQPLQDPLERRRAEYRDSVRRARPTLGPVAPPPPRETTVTRVETPTQVPVQPVAEQPPPPPPVVERRESVAAPPPDPEAVRRAAAQELGAGIQRFVAAITAKQVGTVGTLYSVWGDAKRRDRFLAFLKTSAPTVTPGSVDATAVEGVVAEAGFTVGFRWRGDFGVDRRKDVRFTATARRAAAEDAWTFAGARLMEAFP